MGHHHGNSGCMGGQETVKQTCAHCANAVQGYCGLTAGRERRYNNECVKLGQFVEDCIEVYTYLHLCYD